ncbi:MAG TPA: magnesium transporter, partial [bacterium]|nr:magnesium transporter [bacterium]
DLAELLNELEPPIAAKLLAGMPRKLAAEVADEEEFDLLANLLAHLHPTVAARIVAEMSPDQRADVLQDLPEDLLGRILADLPPVERAEAEELLEYDEDSAGGLMTTEFTSVRPGWTVAEAMHHIRNVARAKETIYAVYVTENSHRGKLQGVLSLRDLLTANPETKVTMLMSPRVISVPETADREEVARTIARYNLLAVPVVDAEGRCRGIVTVDDVIDVIVQAQTEDFLQLGGVSPIEAEHSYLDSPVRLAVRGRLPWLLFLFLGGTATGLVMRQYENVHTAFPDLLIFTPLIIGTGGNVGSQTVTTVVRGLALKEIAPADWARVLLKEVRTGLLIGLILGAVAYAGTRLWLPADVLVAEVVALTVLAICTWSCTVGSMIPITAVRFGMDPAVLSAPLISTLVDATGLIIFFTIAWSILH